ncbi:MAG: SLC26A/SulP transporter family protein [Candidatus Promineifilaceae bacterium]
MSELHPPEAETRARSTHTTTPLLPNISAGLIIGLLQIFMGLSFAALIFSGALSGFLAEGIGLALIGMILLGVIIAAYTSLPGTVGGSQGVPAAIIALMAASIAAEVPAGPASEMSLVTVVVAIAGTAVVTGFFFWLLGRFRLGGLVRFLPYPVVGGFLAGTGWLFLTGAITMMVDMPVSLGALDTLFAPQMLARWLPGLLLALVMLVVTRRSDHYLLLPGMLVGAVLLFFAAARLLGLSPADLSAQGWLLGPFPKAGALWPPISRAMLGQIYWPAITDQLPNMMAVMAVSAIGLLLNAGGLELVVERDLEVNRELQVAGLANVATGLAGGFVGYKQLSLSTLNFKLGGNSRLPGLVAAAVCALVLVAGASLLALFPKVVIGSLLLLLGLNFLYDWVIAGWFDLPKIDYAIVLVILLVTVAVGFLEAVGLGLLLAVVMFVVSYSQVDVVRHELDGRTFQSRVSRSRAQRQVLRAAGDRLFILQLQGFIFFGTANNLLDRLRNRVNDPNQTQPTFILLDFLRVTGLDSTGLLSFTRMKQLAEQAGITLIFTEPNERVLQQLVQGDLTDDGPSTPGVHAQTGVVRIFPSLDQGVEWCEVHFLQDAGVDLAEPPPPLVEQLLEILFPDGAGDDERAQVQQILERLDKLEIGPGEMLIAMGDKADDLFFLESGQVTSQLVRPGRAPVRLETTSSGSVIGEIGLYLGLARTAEVVADTPSILYRLSLADLKEMEMDNPEAASALHQIIIHLLAERVVHLTNSVKALER